MFHLRLAVVLKISLKSLYYSTWVFVNLGAIFGIFETCPKRSLDSLEKVRVVSPEAHVSLEIGSGFKNFNEIPVL